MPRFKVEYKWLVAAAFVAGFFMDLMDATIVNVAIPKLSADLHAPDTTLEWVVTGYLLSLAIWIPASGWIGDKFGTKRTFLFALAAFTISSALCSLAPNAHLLIAARFLQGVGGGMMTPVGIAMLFRAFPLKERAQASSVLAIPTAVAPALGPILGGWLVDYVGWRWVFLVNIPIGIGAFIFAERVLKEHKEPNAGGFDFSGFFLSATGLVLVLYALSVVPTRGPLSPSVIATGTTGIAMLVALVAVESRLKYPILHFSLLRDRMFRISNIVIFFGFALWIGSLFVLPLYLQQLGGFSAFQSGLTTFPQALGWIAMSTVASRIYKRVGPRRMIAAGLAGASLLTLGFALGAAAPDAWLIRLAMFVRGLCMAFAIIPIQTAAFTNVTMEETGRASSLFNTNRQVAASFGTALLGTVLFELLDRAGSSGAQLEAYHVAFIVGGVLGLLAIPFGLMVRDKDAAASMAR